MDFIDEDNGWIVGDAGMIYATRNGGHTWLRQTVETSDTLYKVDFVDERNGWVVSNNAVWNTSNGGVTWTHQLSHSCWYGALSIEFVSPSTGWIKSSTLYHTSDGGDTWQDRKPEEIGGIGRVSFVTENQGFAITCCNVYSTQNSGTEWTELASVRWPFSIDFVDSQVGYVGNFTYLSSAWDDPAYIFKTTDGGNSWIEQTIPQTQIVWDISFIDAESGFAVTGAGPIYTNNGGESWKSVRGWPDDRGISGFALLSSRDLFLLSPTGQIYKYILP
jgi:photosystem II stability/assembly factor-like uncharacterized protein